MSASYRPGPWFGIFGAHATVVLPPSEKARVSRIWAMVDDGAGFDEVLDALIADGLRDLPAFVLVSESEGETKAVIRGPARAEFTTDGDPVVVEGSSVTTWAERSVRGVRAMSIEVADSEGVEDLLIRDGLVRVARVDRPARAGIDHEAGDPGDAPGAGIDEAPTPAASVAVDPPPVAPELDDATAYHPPPAPLAGPQPVRDEPTLAGNWDLAAAAPVQPVVPVARLTFSTGEVVDVDRPVVVGRAPEARRSTSTEEPHLVPVTSPQQEISSTHLEIRPGSGADHGTAVVTDLGSTNGTVVLQPGLPPEDLRPGVPVPLLPGAVVDLGDGVTIQVGPA